MSNPLDPFAEKIRFRQLLPIALQPLEKVLSGRAFKNFKCKARKKRKLEQ
jgi:hypothetical protein